MSNLGNFLSTKYFYSSHLKEVSKYITSETSYINVINSNSNVPLGMFENEIRINTEDTFEKIFSEASKNIKYDVVILTDVFELTDDLYSSLKVIKLFLKDDGKLILSSINPFWNFLLKFMEFFKIKKVTNIKSYIHPKKLENILKAANLTIVRSYNRLCVPFYFLGIGHLINYFMYLIFPFLKFGIRNYSIYSNSNHNKNEMTKSILIPAKNEEGNLEELIERIPKFKTKYEMVIICGESVDGTYEKALDIQNRKLNLEIKVTKQTKMVKLMLFGRD